MEGYTDMKIIALTRIRLLKKSELRFSGLMSRTKVKKTQRLLPIEETDIAAILKVESAAEGERVEEVLPIIRCECGAKILVLPDLKAMNRAIETHVNEHRRNERHIKKNLSSPSKISELLSQLTLIKISQQNKA